MTEPQPAERKWPASKVFLRPIGELIPYAGNARRHPERQIEQIAASIRTLGWTNPILVDEHNVILAGHGRLAAALKLKLKKVPVMVAEGWTADEKRAYVLTDNQLALNSNWDEAMLAQELAGLTAEDVDLNLLGFSDSELAARIAAAPKVDLSLGIETEPTAIVRWGKTRVEVPVEDAQELADVYATYVSKAGTAKGFVNYLLTGTIEGGDDPKVTH